MLTRALRFMRALVVGSGATLTDFSVFTTCSRALGLSPTSARLPALLAGACVQFIGNRSFTFRAQAGSLRRQALFFVLFETLGLGLNWTLFRLLLPRLGWLPPELVTFVASFTVFVAFNYPLRKWIIFRLPADQGVTVSPPIDPDADSAIDREAARHG
jgi:putative flippase GtrA